MCMYVFCHAGTDRNNIVQLLDALENYPMPFSSADSMWSDAQVHWIYFDDTPNISPEDLAINLASSGYYE